MRIAARIFVFCCAMALASGAFAVDENKPDTLTINSTKIKPGESTSLTVNIVNDQELAAIQVPIRVGNGVLIDSATFADSRVDYLNTKQVNITDDRQTVFLGIIVMTEPYLQPGQGLFATLFLSCPDSVTAGAVSVDTTNYDEWSVLFVNRNATDFIPKVKPGSLSVVSEK
jgi:hypothetical protein